MKLLLVILGIVIVSDLLYLAIIYSIYRENNRHDEYYQTWAFTAYRNKFHKFIFKTLCRIITNHEISKTEWGYGGGEYADRWCRWCNKLIKVPKTSIYFKHKEAKDLMDMVNNDTATPPE